MRWDKVKKVMHQATTPVAYLLVCVVGVGGAWINQHTIDQIGDANHEQCLSDNARAAASLAAFMEIDSLLVRDPFNPQNVAVLKLLHRGFAPKDCDAI